MAQNPLAAELTEEIEGRLDASTDGAAREGVLDAGHDHDEHDHPDDGSYVKIAFFLGFLTLIEVGTYWPFGEFFESSDLLLIGTLTVLMIAKFVIVVMYFMHLKFDSKWYTYAFVTGVALAMMVYFIVFFAENLF